jgi:very-short-patch-repair endonuclease
MGKQNTKHTQEYVASFLKEEGYALCSIYKNNRTKMITLCPRGHKYEVCFSNFKNNIRCNEGECRHTQPKRIKFKEKEIIAFLHQEGYQLTSPIIDASTRLSLICPNGHIYKVSWTSFARGTRCLCKHGSTPWTIEQICDIAFKEGYKVISKEYKNTQTKLILECRRGHTWKVSWSGFYIHENRCPSCIRIDRTYTHESVKDFIEKRGYKLLSKYIHNTMKMKIECPRRHQYLATWNTFQHSICPECSLEKKRHNLEKISQEVKHEGYEILSPTYQNNKTKLTMRCPDGHIFQITWSCFQVGARCPLHRESKGERGLRKILEQLYPYKMIRDNDNLGFLGHQQIDLSIRDFKLAFEYDGAQHFKPVLGAFGCKTIEDAWRRFQKQQEWDARKNLLCAENGYTMIRIAYNEKMTLESVKQKIESSERDLKCLR